MAITRDEKKITDLLKRGTEDVFVRESLERKLKSGKRLTIKLGIDPTSPNIHLGRAVVLRKLRRFQNLGHNIVLIIGDFTAQIGDPSDKLQKRPMISKKEIKKNLRGYKRLIGLILNNKKTNFLYNSSWLKRLKLSDFIELTEAFSVLQMSARRNFKERIDKGEEVSLREFLYPLLQGYDSAKINADVEVGGFDQLFNLKAGRMVQRYLGKKEQDILTITMLEGTDGRKMSSSWGNVINIDEKPSEMFGKIMSIRDELIIKYFILCTDVSIDLVNELEGGLKNNTKNPKDIKSLLAYEIVKIYHGEEIAKKEKDNFEKVFAGGGVPKDLKENYIKQRTTLFKILVEKNVVNSKSEFKRLVEGGGVVVFKGKGSEKINDVNFVVIENCVIRAGKKKFLKLVVR